MSKMRITAGAAPGVCAPLAMAQNSNPSWYIQPSVNAFLPDMDFGVDERDYGAGLKIGKPVSALGDVQIGATHARAKEGRASYRQSLLGADALLMLSRADLIACLEPKRRVEVEQIIIERRVQ